MITHTSITESTVLRSYQTLDKHLVTKLLPHCITLLQGCCYVRRLPCNLVIILSLAIDCYNFVISISDFLIYIHTIMTIDRSSCFY